MTRTCRAAITAVSALLVAAAAGAQAAPRGRSIVLGVYGGGYDHMLNLNSAGTADFKFGYSLGATLGMQLNRYFGVHGDFTFARNQAEGSASFSGMKFNRFFYGAHVEGRYPGAIGITPYAFLGGGAISIDEVGSTATLKPFTKPAAAFGVGVSFTIPRSGVDLFAEEKDLVFRWDQGGFDRLQWDFMFSAGLSYRFAWPSD